LTICFSFTGYSNRFQFIVDQFGSLFLPKKSVVIPEAFQRILVIGIIQKGDIGKNPLSLKIEICLSLSEGVIFRNTFFL